MQVYDATCHRKGKRTKERYEKQSYKQKNIDETGQMEKVSFVMN